MKREQLTNVTTESIDQRCTMLAGDGMSGAIDAGYWRHNVRFYDADHCEWLARQSEARAIVAADRIIALREGEANGVQS